MQKIEITPINLRFQKPTEVREAYIELFENYLRCRWSFFADEPIISEDENSGWESVFNDFDIIALKEKISGVEKSITTHIPKCLF